MTGQEWQALMKHVSIRVKPHTLSRIKNSGMREHMEEIITAVVNWYEMKDNFRDSMSRHVTETTGDCGENDFISSLKSVK